MMRMGGKDVSQRMSFERHSLPITSFKDKSMTEEAHTGCHRQVRYGASAKLKQIGTCRKTMCSAIAWIKRHARKMLTRLELIVLFQQLKCLLEISLSFYTHKVISRFI